MILKKRKQKEFGKLKATVEMTNSIRNFGLLS